MDPEYTIISEERDTLSSVILPNSGLVYMSAEISSAAERVPTLSVVCMVLSCVCAFALPTALFFYIRKKKGGDILPFFVGCGVMLLFAFSLESAVHRLILRSSAGTVILNNIWLYALYGGLMAGIFEESGRFIAFRTILKGDSDVSAADAPGPGGKDVNALMYGAGHGGFEAAVILGLGMMQNLTYTFMIQSGNRASLTEGLSEELAAQVNTVIETLIATQPYEYLLGLVERIFAIALHISLSVLVWFSVKRKGKGYLFPLAIFIHFCVDALTVILSRSGVSLPLLEGIVGLLSLSAALFAKRVWVRSVT